LIKDQWENKAFAGRASNFYLPNCKDVVGKFNKGANQMKYFLIISVLLLIGCAPKETIKQQKPDNFICLERGHYDADAKSKFYHREFIDDSSKDASYKVTIFTYYSWGICERCGKTFNYKKDADTIKKTIWERPKTFQEEVEETVNKILGEKK
jgi:hypothetical protein